MTVQNRRYLFMTEDDFSDVVTLGFTEWVRSTGNGRLLDTDHPALLILKTGYVQGYCTATLDMIEVLKPDEVRHG